MATYKKQHPPIRLGTTSIIRQNRIDLNPIFHCISWREKRQPSNSNRRFYCEGDEFWSLSINQALEMMERARQEGFFDANADDPGKIQSVIVAEPRQDNYMQLISKALVESVYETEWKNGTAIICSQSCGKWRKVMIVNRDFSKVTFRSLTSDNTYRFARRETSADGWHLDRAMLDAHPTAFEHWLNYLQSIQHNG